MIDYLCKHLTLTPRQVAILTLGYYRLALDTYILDAFSQLQGNDIDG
jgi:hypothetical protein